ncbi:MAG: peptidoglycan D,D-transpeptidase FtsI family protein [Candidatus Paceibacterota bacterium]
MKKVHSSRETHEEKIFLNRARLSYFFIVICFLLLVYRLYQLQIIQHQNFIEVAEASRKTEQILPPHRGEIYFQDKEGNLILVATNRLCYLLYAVPKEIEEPEKIAHFLVETFKNYQTEIEVPSFEEIFKKLSKENDPYEPILKEITNEELVQTIKEATLKGIYFQEGECRYYPYDSLAAHVIGFVSSGDDGNIKGRYGLEAYYDSLLSGEEGVFEGFKDAFGRLIHFFSFKEKEVKNGVNLVVTIDKNIQMAAEKALSKLIEGREAQGGNIIVMEAKTGKILAMAQYPSFNLNEYKKVKDYSLFLNSAVQERYEPGSVIKTITMAAGLDASKVTPETTYIDKGYYEIGGYKIVNYNNEVYGKVNMYKVLERSINTGAIFVANQLGVNLLRSYFKVFGFTEPTGIDLPYEVVGDLSNLEYPKYNPTYLATASYGVGISVTPIRLVQAYAVLANQGRSVAPYLLEKVIEENGSSFSMAPSETPQSIIKPETSAAIMKMLVSVIENGFGGNAKIKGYSLAGKTGTAFIADKNGGYTTDEIHTFIGIFPASNPRYVILVKMEKPKYGKGAASHTVTLAFKEVEQFLINYYNISPDEIEVSQK